MIQNIKAPISVTLQFNHIQKKVYPNRLIYEGKDYLITKLGYHHTYRQGCTLYHIFSIATQTMFFKLKLNTDTLFWQVEQIGDNEVN